ncbi:MAG: alpha/beta hydrolase [Lentisphaeria bacterium]|nr:alpha/beta hydrolase [Lentisphaeria bacterium]
MEIKDKTAMPLWCGTPPAGESDPGQIPVITPYFPPAWKVNHRALVIFPGGGYHALAQYEGYGFAEFFAAQGYFCFVVNYRLGGDLGKSGCHHPAEISDAARAVRLARSLAGVLDYRPDKIGVVGSSAGGHLAASVSILPELGLTIPEEGETAKISSRPNFTILCYPVISLKVFTHQGTKMNLLGENFDPKNAEKLSLENSIDANTPPAFLYHRLGDTAVPCENSLMYARALRKFGIPFELHIYEKGNHGGALAQGHPWAAEALRWMDTL